MKRLLFLTLLAFALTANISYGQLVGKNISNSSTLASKVENFGKVSSDSFRSDSFKSSFGQSGSANASQNKFNSFGNSTSPLAKSANSPLVANTPKLNSNMNTVFSQTSVNNQLGKFGSPFNSRSPNSPLAISMPSKIRTK